jgi:DNA-binding transcriptional MerR regulator
MLKIGDFSRLSQVSVKTLRYYDEVALLKPTQVDEVSGYRYYSVAQLRQLHRILALRDLGFSLDQIGYVLEADLSIQELRGMLRLRRAEQQQRLLKEQERLDRVEALIKTWTAKLVFRSTRNIRGCQQYDAPICQRSKWQASSTMAPTTRCRKAIRRF